LKVAREFGTGRSVVQRIKAEAAVAPGLRAGRLGRATVLAMLHVSLVTYAQTKDICG
jgi:hypothetical protein